MAEHPASCLPSNEVQSPMRMNNSDTNQAYNFGSMLFEKMFSNLQQIAGSQNHYTGLSDLTSGNNWAKLSPENRSGVARSSQEVDGPDGYGDKAMHGKSSCEETSGAKPGSSGGHSEEVYFNREEDMPEEEEDVSDADDMSDDNKNNMDGDVEKQHPTFTMQTNEVTGEKLYQCVLCEKTFLRKGILDDHARIHSGEKPFKCMLCDKSFNCKSNFSRHLRVHTGEKPHHCSLCNKSFSQRIHLQDHMRAHFGEKPYQCTICDKSFGNRSNLNRHIKAHIGEGFRCSVCDKTFNIKGNLNRHMKLHEDSSQRYKCTVCDESFSKKSILGVHMETHFSGDQYHCMQCDKSFGSEALLRQHVEIHFMEKTHNTSSEAPHPPKEQGPPSSPLPSADSEPIVCVLCGKTFSQNNYLVKHMEQHHEEIMGVMSATAQSPNSFTAALQVNLATATKLMAEHHGSNGHPNAPTCQSHPVHSDCEDELTEVKPDINKQIV